MQWDQLKKKPISSVTPPSGAAAATAAPVIVPRMLMIPSVGVMMNPMPGAVVEQEARPKEEPAMQKKHEDELQRKRERDRERREKKRQEREAARMLDEGDSDSAVSESLTNSLARDQSPMIEDDEDDSYDGQRRRKRSRRDEVERDELAEEEEELEYGEGSGEAPKLGTMQGNFIPPSIQHSTSPQSTFNSSSSSNHYPNNSEERWSLLLQDDIRCTLRESGKGQGTHVGRELGASTPIQFSHRRRRRGRQT